MFLFFSFSPHWKYIWPAGSSGIIANNNNNTACLTHNAFMLLSCQLMIIGFHCSAVLFLHTPSAAAAAADRRKTTWFIMCSIGRFLREFFRLRLDCRMIKCSADFTRMDPLGVSSLRLVGKGARPCLRRLGSIAGPVQEFFSSSLGIELAQLAAVEVL